jgi:hypothetical protein
MVKFYYKNVGPGGKVIVLMGSGGKQPRTINGRPITLQDSVDIWETYLRNDPDIDWPSDRIQFQNVEGAGPIAPIIDYMREQADPETEVIHLGAGEKDTGRWKMMMDDPKNNPRGVEIRIEPAPNLFDAQGNPLSASAMRQAVEEKDLETFKNYIPDTSLHMAEDMYVKLSGAMLMERKEDDPLPLGIFLGLIEEAIGEKENLLNERPPDVTLPPVYDDKDDPTGAMRDAILKSVPKLKLPTLLDLDLSRGPDPEDLLRNKVRAEFLKSYESGANREAWTGPMGYIWRKDMPTAECQKKDGGCTQKDVEDYYDEKYLRRIKKTILETPIIFGIQYFHPEIHKKTGKLPKGYFQTPMPGQPNVKPEIHIRTHGFSDEEIMDIMASEIPHAIDASLGFQHQHDFEKLQQAFPWLKRKADRYDPEKHGQVPAELYLAGIKARLPTYLGRSFTAKDLNNIRSGIDPATGTPFKEFKGEEEFKQKMYKDVQDALFRNEQLGVDLSDEEMADILKQVSQVDPIQDPFQEPTMVAENTFSSNELLRLIEGVMNEEKEEEFSSEAERIKKINQPREDYIKSYTDPTGAHKEAWLRHLSPEIYGTLVEPFITEPTKNIPIGFTTHEPSGKEWKKNRYGMYNPGQKGSVFLGRPETPAEIYINKATPEKFLDSISGHEIGHHYGVGDLSKYLKDVLWKHSRILNKDKWKWTPTWSKPENLSELFADELKQMVDIDEDGVFARSWGHSLRDNAKHHKGWFDYHLKSEELHANAEDLRRIFYKELGRDLTEKDLSNVCLGGYGSGKDEEAAAWILSTHKLGRSLSCKDIKKTMSLYKTVVKAEPQIQPQIQTRAFAEGVMAHARNNDLKVWNPAALEAANKNEDEELEEASGVSAVVGYSGPGKRIDSLIREEEDELVEEVMNYLLHKNGAK